MRKSKEMVDHKTAFINSSYYEMLRREVSRGYRIVNHALDNYGMDMSKELEEALQRLSKAIEEVLQVLKADKHNEN